MIDSNRWLLPGGIDEVLPPRAWQVEKLRRQLLDLYRCWGYELVIPPFIEYLESLLTGVGSDLDLQTFKVTDQLTGRMMGIRADMTPQVARIDAHSINAEGTLRLCYSGSVLHTRPQNSLSSRSPLQIGAELYGNGTIAADIEIVRLMLETLSSAGLKNLHLDLGHVGIYRALAEDCAMNAELQKDFFALLQRKAKAELQSFVSEQLAGRPHAEMLVQLADLYGGEEVLAQARRLLAQAPAAVQQCIDSLQQLAAAVRQSHPQTELYFDLGELRGYQYHTGVVYSAYLPGYGQAVAKGGRYDDIGRVFGRARPATGFSADLKALIELTPTALPSHCILAPVESDPALARLMQELRAAGEIVVQLLPGDPQQTAVYANADRRLEQQDGIWRVTALSPPAL